MLYTYHGWSWNDEGIAARRQHPSATAAREAEILWIVRSKESGSTSIGEDGRQVGVARAEEFKLVCVS